MNRRSFLGVGCAGALSPLLAKTVKAKPPESEPKLPFIPRILVIALGDDDHPATPDDVDAYADELDEKLRDFYLRTSVPAMFEGRIHLPKLSDGILPDPVIVDCPVNVQKYETARLRIRLGSWRRPICDQAFQEFKDDFRRQIKHKSGSVVITGRAIVCVEDPVLPIARDIDTLVSRITQISLYEIPFSEVLR